MFKQQFKLAWRNLRKNHQFAFLNLIGLSTGLACALSIYLWVSDELNVNRFGASSDRVYQVMQSLPEGNGAIQNTPGLLASALPAEMPDVAYASAVVPPTWFSDKGLFSFGNTHIRAGGGFVSQDFFAIFPLHFTEGTATQLFASKNNVLISQELALKLFGTTTNVVGKVIEWNQRDLDGTYAIAGIYEKFPSNSTLQFDAMFNYAHFLDKNPKLQKWTNNDPNTYVLLKAGVDAAAFNKKIADFVKTKESKSNTKLFAQLFSDTYLYTRYENGVPSGGRIEYVKLFSIIGVFILLIACINFMNLSTAKAAKRLKEVGIQKVVGASRRSLIAQYMAESLLMSFLSLIIAIGLVALLLPAIREITGKSLGFQFDSTFVLAITCITFITGLIAGSYPAVYLSRFEPVLVLKGVQKSNRSEAWTRKALVVFQFAVSVIFIVSVLVVYQQMQLIETTDVGYNREQVIYFDKGGKQSANKEDYKQGAVYKDLETFLEQVKNIPGVVNASNFRHSIVNRDGGTTDVLWEGKSPNDQTTFTDIACGYNFIETLGIELKEGRSYSKDFGSDKDKVVVNEAAVKAMGLKDPVGKTVTIWGDKKQIIGVTKDFHFQSFYENIKPCFFDLSMNGRVAKIIVRVKAGAEKATIHRLAEFYKSYTGEALDAKFLDEDYQALYASEERVARLSKYFAGIAIVISCLGLFGLAAFTAQKRSKEISIRKVMGASVSGIVALLTKDFLGLVFLSLAIAVPVSWWLTSAWLQGFAYRIQLTPTVFLTAAIAVMAITVITISFQSIKAAMSNPVKSLRTE